MHNPARSMREADQEIERGARARIFYSFDNI